MREGLIPHSVTTILRAPTSADAARTATEQLGEIFDPDETGVAAFEDRATGHWVIHVYFAQPPHQPSMRELIASVLGEAAAAEMQFEEVTAKDWVAASLDGLRPV
jgi:ribosomal protein L11 methyltransferase